MNANTKERHALVTDLQNIWKSRSITASPSINKNVAKIVG